MIHRLPCALLAALLLAAPAHAREMLPPGFVYLRDVDSSIAQDMRYATADNFTGRPLPGYDAAECVLRREAAEALRRVQADLARENLGLKVYDCYRPTRAVRAMEALGARWHDSEATRRFYPTLHKRNLFALGYIAARSTHSTGTDGRSHADRLPAAPAPPSTPQRVTAPAPAPAAARAPDNSIDMGTGFDCFDLKSYGPTRRSSRAAALARRADGGDAQARVSNYLREWWHSSFTAAAEPRSYDFAIVPKGR